MKSTHLADFGPVARRALFAAVVHHALRDRAQFRHRIAQVRYPVLQIRAVFPLDVVVRRPVARFAALGFGVLGILVIIIVFIVLLFVFIFALGFPFRFALLLL